MQRETAEAPDLDTVTGRQRLTHILDEGLYGLLDVTMGVLAKTIRQLLDKFGFGHFHRRAG
jgi:hypothetical protein